MSLLSDDETSFAQVARVLSSDASLSAQVLRLANSPLGGRYGATTILQALSLLGVARVSALVLTLGVSKFLKRAGKSDLVRRCWRHNLACALAAKDFAKTFEVDTDLAYTAGLLHDIGRLALLASNPGEYEKMTVGEAGLRQAEQEHFGIDHCRAGGWLIREWKLPQVYAEVAECHHEPLGDSSHLTNLVHVGCAVADQIGFSVLSQGSPEGELVVTEDLSASIATTINAFECEYGL
jgi:putative nucleotidyltransferase with HDIG domain